MHASCAARPGRPILRATIALLVLVLSGVGVASTPAASGAPTGSDPRADWPAELVLGISITNEGEAAVENNMALVEFISRRVGLAVRPVALPGYTPTIEALRERRIDATNIGPFPYVLAVQEAGVEALAVQVGTRKEPAVYEPDIRPAYFSVISTKKGSGISRLEDLKGRSFSFVDPVSASGHLIPKAFLLKHGINPDQDMAAAFAGSHPKVLMAIWTGEADAGASQESQLYTLAQNKQIEFCGFPDGEVGKDRGPAEVEALFDACPAGKIAMLAYSDPIPNTAFAIRSELPAGLKAAVQEALLAVKDEPDVIARTKRWYVDPHQERGLPSLDAYYDPLRETARILNLDLKGLE